MRTAALRRHGTASLREGERRMLMGHELSQQIVGLAQALGNSTVVQLQTNRKRVDEHTDHTIGAFTAAHAPEQNGAENDICFARNMA